MAIQRVLTVSFDEMFPHGAWLVSVVEPVRDFKRSSRGDRPGGGARRGRGTRCSSTASSKAIWQVEVMDGDEEVTGEAKKFRVKIVAVRRPVPPPAAPGTPFRPVVLDGLRVQPWVNRDRCRVEQGQAASVRGSAGLVVLGHGPAGGERSTGPGAGAGRQRREGR